MIELEKAHQDYEERKEKVIEDLKILQSNTSNTIVWKMLDNAIKFIKEKEI